LITSTIIWFTKLVAKEKVEGSWIRTRNEQARDTQEKMIDDL